MKLIEPLRGQNLLHILNTAVYNSATLTQIVPVLADIFVFVYPILLLVWYIWGIIQRSHLMKSNAIVVALSAVYVTIINLSLQSFLDKARPIFAGDNSIHMILKDLPTASFPSDHAAISMVIALTVLSIGYYNRNKSIKFLGYALLVTSIIMSLSRVAVGVHWPTDIIAGWIVAMVVVYIINIDQVRSLQSSYIINPIINFQQRLFSLVGITYESSNHSPSTAKDTASR